MVWYNHPYFEIRLLSSSKIGFVVQKKKVSLIQIMHKRYY